MDYNYRKNTAFLCVSEINQICKGLFKKMNINAFSYSKIYTDGSRAELWSDIHALEHSFFIKQHISKVYTPNLFNMQKFVIYDHSLQTFPKKTQERISNQLKDQRDLFNHANCLFVIDYQSDYTEYCAFYTPASNHAAVNNYLNNTDELTKFRRFFKHRAKEIITKADRNKLIFRLGEQEIIFNPK